MLLKLFAGLSAAATALNISSPRVEFTGIKLAGFALLRFAEFYIGALLAYIAAVYAASELTVDMEKPQEKPSKFWQWNMNELAEIICVLVGARVTVTGTTARYSTPLRPLSFSAQRSISISQSPRTSISPSAAQSCTNAAACR